MSELAKYYDNKVKLYKPSKIIKLNIFNECIKNKNYL